MLSLRKAGHPQRHKQSRSSSLPQLGSGVGIKQFHVRHHPLLQLYRENIESDALALRGIVIQQLTHALNRLIVVIQNLQVLHGR